MIHVVNLCNSLAEWKHAMIVSHYINIILILISCLILSLNLVTQMWKIILKYPGTFQYTFCRAHYETSKNWRNFIISNCPGGCQGNWQYRDHMLGMEWRCEIHSKMSHSVDWREQRTWAFFFKICQVYTDQLMGKVIQKISFWGDYINEAVCYLHNSSPWVCNPVLVNFIQNN